MVPALRICNHQQRPAALQGAQKALLQRLRIQSAVIAEARRVVGEGGTYVSFDVDALDPVYALGTGTPEIGGLTTLESQRLVRGLQGLNLIGGDVVEVSPPFVPSGNTALVGATMAFEILCVLADSVSKKKAAAL